MSQLLPERRSRLLPGRWDPFNEFDQVTERMRRLLDETFSGAGWPAPAGRDSWSPLVDLEETDDAYLIEAELPGVKREDVNVELIGKELQISGEVKEERERKGVLRQQMRRSGRFSYRVALPDRADADGIEASLNDGVLRVRLANAERAERRKIAIK
jgi:HSP20 family protein